MTQQIIDATEEFDEDDQLKLTVNAVDQSYPEVYFAYESLLNIFPEIYRRNKDDSALNSSIENVFFAC